LLSSDALGGEDGIEQAPAVVGYLIAMGVRQLLKDAVCTQEAEFTADCSGAAAGLDLGSGWGGIQQCLQIAITQAVDGELAAIHSPQQFQIRRFEWMQGAHPVAVPGHAFFDRLDQFAERSRVIHPSERSAIPVECLLRYFGPTV